MLDDREKKRLRELKDDERAAECKAQIHRAHNAVNSGTLDRAEINDALDRLTAMVVSPQEEKPVKEREDIAKRENDKRSQPSIPPTQPTAALVG